MCKKFLESACWSLAILIYLFDILFISPRTKKLHKKREKKRNTHQCKTKKKKKTETEKLSDYINIIIPNLLDLMNAIISL